jgi:hypothetical protein
MGADKRRRASEAHVDHNVVGIDMGAALRTGPARGFDVAALSELLPAAEAGLVEALAADRSPSD